MIRPPLLAVAFFIGVGALGCTNRRPPAPPDPGPPVVTVSKPVVKSIKQFTDLTGSLAAAKTVDVRSRVTGRIKSVAFKDGQSVKKGELLVQIDPAPFEIMVLKAAADVQNAEAKLEAAKSTENRLSRATGGAASQDEKEQAIANRKVADANLALAQASAADAKLNLGYANVVAPFDGVVDRILKDEGSDVTGGTGQGTVLTTLVSDDPIYAYFDVDEATVLVYIRLINEGKRKSGTEEPIPVEIQLKDEKGYPHKGFLDFFSNRLNPTTGSLQIRGSFPNPVEGKSKNPTLKPGYFVRGRIPLTTATNAILIPDSAVVTDQALKVVYVVGPDKRVVAKKVILGPINEGLRIVVPDEKGIIELLPTDDVIVRGLQRVIPGAIVEPQEGPIAPAPPKK